jgi:prefoldin subunit 5
MNVTRESLAAKRADLAAQLQQAQANFHALSGAMQLCDQLIAELDQEAAPSPPPDEPLEVPED